MADKGKDKNEMARQVANVLADRPHGFLVDGRQFFLYPLTLGKMYRLQPAIESLGINESHLERDLSLEALRLVKERKEECLKIIYCHTCKNKEELDDVFLMRERMELFKKEIPEEDLAGMLVMLLSADKTSLLIHHLGIDKEQDDMSTIMRIKDKDSKGSITFGGRTVFGTLLDAACERYGWTDEYVTWGISYTKLRLMLADKVNTVYVTDEERRKIPARILNSREKDVVNGDNKEEVKKAIRSQSWN